MNNETQVFLVSVEDGFYEVSPNQQYPCYFVSFNVPLLNSVVKIEVFKDKIKSYSSIIPLAQHYLSLRLKHISDKYRINTLSEEQLSELVSGN